MSQRPKLKVLVEELHSVKTKWRPIGIQLEVPMDSMKIIGSAHKDDPEQAFTELMYEWLKQTDPEPSWAAIVEALRSRSVGEADLANSVERNMCPKRADNPTPPANAELQQLEAVEAVLTDHLSLEHNHALELQMVPPHEIKEVPPKVRNAIKTLAKSLNRLRIDTYHHVVAIEISVNEFRVVICNPERLWEEEDRKRILLADTIEFIFAVISDKKYLNWQNYELLEEIIEAYGDSKLKGKFETYCKDMERFENESPLQDVKNIIFTPLRSNVLLMKVPIPDGISSPTLSLVRTMKSGLKRNGYPHAICCHHIGENSPLAIFFIIPRPFIPTISMAKLSTSNSEKIEDRVICTLTEEEILQLMDPPVPPVHQDGMPPCDTTSSSNESLDSEEPKSKLTKEDSLQSYQFLDPISAEENKAGKVRAELDSKQEEIQQDFQEHIQNLQGRAEGAEKELQEVRESKNRLEEEMSNRIAKLACRNSDLEEKIKAAETEIEKSKRDSESMEHSYHAELKDVTAEKNSACKNLMKERETLGTMENKIRELEAEKAHVKQQLDCFRRFFSDNIVPFMF